MAVKNNDDVAHLLDATGSSGSSYREFDSPAEHTSAPLVDAVFGKGPPAPLSDDEGPPSLEIEAGRGDLLSEVFDRGPPRSQHETTRAFAPLAKKDSAQPADPPAFNTSRRTLDDIRRIIMRPAEDPAKAPPNDSLNGLFDRLVG
jgi:hypothetical protein